MAKLTTPKFETQEYILDEDRNLPESEQTIWLLRGLSVADATEVKNLLACETKRVSAARLAAMRGIVGWSNLDGLEFKGRLYPQDEDRHKRCTPEEFKIISRVRMGEWIEELGLEVIRLSQLEDTEKNS